ncbi:hypothetical protein FGG08_002154 [Glutinoglossum americanum]|uniref:Monooxygenase n=1 Tax=Glutinoglossum americanum TaxID=1670608 RepID=A0A9P8I5J1_9PEZI|nr:hypothetical protein FGG08_002154 [Glutinoglossum americanum]
MNELSSPPQSIRDNFSLSTWLLLGATIQSLLFLLLPTRFSLAPAVLILTYRTADALLMASGLRKNPYLGGVIHGKFTAQIPDRQGGFSKETSNEGICIFMVGARANHPLGMFAPGFKELGDFFRGMVQQLEKNPEESGFLGASSWAGSDRTSSNETTTVIYFRSLSHIHAFAHSPAHRAGLAWWNARIAAIPHVAIMHEVYQNPSAGWENIYINYHLTGLAATTYRAPGEKWVSPVVGARRGGVRSGAGGTGEDGGYGDGPYAHEE